MLAQVRSAMPHRGAPARLTPRAAAAAQPPPPPFRRATPADAPAIRALVAASKMNPLALHPDRFLVADGDGGGGGLAAVGQLAPLDGGGDGGHPPLSVEVRSLVVDPARRGRGLGSALLAALLASAPPTARTAWLTTLAGRAPFYERAGFEVAAGGGGGGGRPPTSLLAAVVGAGGDGAAAASLPAALRFEVLVGSVAAPLLGGDRLVVMRRELP